MLEFAYRYTTEILEEAKVYSNHTKHKRVSKGQYLKKFLRSAFKFIANLSNSHFFIHPAVI